jgi:hypothetical protein
LTNELGLVYPGRRAAADFTVGPGAAAIGIVAPDAFRDEAAAIGRELSRIGCPAVELVADRAAVTGRAGGLKPGWRERSLILVGNLEQNEAVFQLYARFLTDADAETPGPGGYMIQHLANVHAPGHHVLLVAGSDMVGTRTAAEQMLQILRQRAPGVWNLAEAAQASYAGTAAERREAWTRRARRLPVNDVGWRQFSQIADACRMHPGDVAELLDKAGDIAAAARTNEWLTLDNHYGMGLPARGWDALARSGRIDPAAVRRMDALFFHYLVNMRNAWWRRHERHPVFADNRHHVYGTYGYWKVAEMLLRGLDPDARRTPAGRFLAERVRECERWLLAGATRYEPPVLSVGVFINTTVFLLSAAQTGQTEVFTSGKARRLAALGSGVLDNLGGRAGLSGYEDTYPGAWRETYGLGAALPLVACIDRDPRLQALLLRQTGLNADCWWELSPPWHRYARSAVATPVPPPPDFEGVMPLLGTPRKPLFLAYRERHHPDALYLLLTGDGRASIDQGDSGKGFQVYPNMIARLSWGGTPWFVLNTNHETPFNRTMLTIHGVNHPQAICDNLRLVRHDRTGGVQFITTLAPDTCGMDWSRSLTAVSNRFLVVTDTLRARGHDRFALVASWRTPYPVDASGDGWLTLRNNDRLLHMTCLGEAFTYPPEHGRAREIEGAALDPWMIRWPGSATLKRGEATHLHTVFDPAFEGRPRRYAARRAGAAALLLRDEASGETWLLGQAPYRDPELVVDAAAFVVASREPAVLSGRRPRMSLAGRHVDPAAPSTALGAHLERLWQMAGGGDEPPASAASWPRQPLWRYAVTNRIWPRLTDFTYEAPGASGGTKLFDDHFDRSAAVRWPPGSNLNVTVSFPGPQYVQEARVWLSQQDTWRTNLPAAAPVTVEALDLSASASRPLAGATRPCRRAVVTYKGALPTLAGAARSIGAPVTRLGLRAPTGAAIKMEILGGVAAPAGIVDAISFSRSAQGPAAVLLRTSDDAVICLDAATGRERWNVRLPAPILSWAAADADGDGQAEIGVAAADTALYRLNPETGAILWRCDLGAYPLPRPYDLAIVTSTQPGQAGFALSTYYHVRIVGLDGVLRNPDDKILPGMWLFDIMGGIDLNGDGFGDTISRALWGHVNLRDGRTGTTDYFGNLRGRLVDWRLLTNTPGGNPELLILARGGLGRYEAHFRPGLAVPGFDDAPDEDGLLAETRSHRERWAHDWHDQPVALARWRDTWLVAHASGLVARYADDGTPRGRHLAEGLVRAAVTVGEGPDALLVLSTAREIAVYDWNWRLRGRLDGSAAGLLSLPGRRLLVWTAAGEARMEHVK